MTRSTITVKNPIDDSVVTSEVQVAGPADVDAAVAAARAAFQSGPWKSFTGAQRAACMNKLADLIEANLDGLCRLESIAMGQPIVVGKTFTSFSISQWRYYAGFSDKIGGEMFPEDGDGTYKLVRYEPLGILINFFKIIFKSSEKSPLGVLAMGKLVVEAGFPPGVINFISGGGETGHLLANHMDIDKISFTGSVQSGRKVQQAATNSNLKRVTLELGGKSPSLIFNDADMEMALTPASQGFLVNSGQVCAAASRTFVQEGIAPKFIEALKDKFEYFVHAMGDPLAPNTFLGPLADRIQLDRVMTFLEEGKKDAQVLTGGGRHGNKGNFIEPTIFLDPPKESKIYTDEIFGPVLVVKTFKTEAEVVKLANDTSYGLAAYLYTSDITRALRVSANLEAGSVFINGPFMPTINTPFGGLKQSGNGGRESGKHGLMSYLEPKSILIK
ncbi:hypothetical protein LTR47_010820 [Exophiala xenobiotica]|nr:hypothetical protein LTR92_011481 [Exophiala xenobiotica]KAK5202884.1 hypothetical protein LTR41_011372 [Exophiala xenobiotica]KAK5221580.1 hypothetical protein LTR47_010820 [Exophiala xenobiotica]KAK5283732.1 hypothetical protein LTR14_011832 [Exophiala xenobiotica]KAK5345250.1 hypothetical protein LTR61_010971 [Exophiala xenobiotica]